MKLSGRKVVVIGGGTGVFTALTGLKNYFAKPTAIVAMSDDGGSTGKLREEFGILPPGDIRRALVALSESDNKILSELFSYRFTEGKGLAGHSFGNLMLTALERITGSFDQAVDEAAKILSVRGEVIPATLRPSKLYALLENGKIVEGESSIDVPKHNSVLRIKHVWLEPPVEINPVARKAILSADAVIIGPGDLYTSLLPNLLIAGMSEALRQTRATVIYAVNIMTKKGETSGFKASEFLREMQEYLGENVIDAVLVNNVRPSRKRLEPYLSEGAAMVEDDLDFALRKPKVVAADLIRARGFIRHDPDKLAKVIAQLVG